MADKTIYYKTDTTGGGAGAIDGINGNTLISKDIAHVFSSDENRSLHYIATTGGTTENPPFDITPDANSSKWSWAIQLGLNDYVEEITTTGGTLRPYGVSHINLPSGLTNGTYSLATPSARGARKAISINGNTSSVIRIVTEATGTIFGTTGNIHTIKHDSDPNLDNRRLIPSLELFSYSTNNWRWLNQYSSGSRTFSSGRTT